MIWLRSNTPDNSGIGHTDYSCKPVKLTQRIKITEAKEYVAQKLGITVMDLADEEVMHPVRQDLDIATLPMIADGAGGSVAKCRIAELLNKEIAR